MCPLMSMSCGIRCTTLRDQLQSFARVGVHLRLAAREHRQALLVDDLDAQPLRRIVDEQALGQTLQFRAFGDRLAHLPLGLVELLLLARAQQFVDVFLRHLAGRGRSLTVGLGARADFRLSNTPFVVTVLPASRPPPPLVELRVEIGAK